MRFFTSDTHFGHQNIIKYCNRPFDSVDHMNEMLIHNWNSVVHEEDLVFHLGDVALGPWEAWNSILTRLNGTKILVVGNHDRIFLGEKERNRERFAPMYANWFTGGIFHNLGGGRQDAPGIMLDNGLEVQASHFPYDGDSHDGDRYTQYRLKDTGIPLIHGHTHRNQIMSKSKNGTMQVHVGADAWNYTPVSEDQIINLIEGLE
jgi:calcineurin-like phosphoesterase family protein